MVAPMGSMRGVGSHRPGLGDESGERPSAVSVGDDFVLDLDLAAVLGLVGEQLVVAAEVDQGGDLGAPADLIAV